MTQHDQLVPGGADYWSKDIMNLDAQQKKYRSIPVPAILSDNQKDVDDITRLELLVEHLATKNDFKIPFPNVVGLSPEDQVAAYTQYLDDVMAAPPHQQEDAQRSLGGHLKDFGTGIKNSLLGGLQKAMGAPGVQTTFSAISAPGEETTAQLLYNFARFIPGEQDIERGVHKWQEENPDAPWWKRATLTSAVRQEGFGVPMGVHLPMEIIFDPLNLIPLGAAFKLGKIPLQVMRLTKQGHSVSDSIRYLKRARRMKQAFEERVKAGYRDLDDNFKFYDNAVVDESSGVWDDVNGVFRERELTPEELLEGGRGPGWMPEASPEDSFQQDLLVAGLHIDEAGTAAYGKRVKEADQGLRNDAEVGDLGWAGTPSSVDEAGNVVAQVRRSPKHDSLSKIISDDAYWRTKPDGTKGVWEEGVRTQWALKMLYHTGIRPHELPYVKWQAILQAISDSGRGGKVKLNVTYMPPGTKKLKASQRLLDTEAIDFLKEYRAYMEPNFARADRIATMQPGDAAFKLPTPLSTKKDPESLSSGLNKMFFDAANSDAHKVYGEDLTNFYQGNGIYTYVFRLSKANQVFTSGNGRNIVATMETLGHASTINTARYVSLLNHTMGTGMGHLLRQGHKIEVLHIHEANLALNAPDAAWKTNLLEQGVDIKEIEKLSGGATGKLDAAGLPIYNKLNVYSNLTTGAQTQKGFSDAIKLAAADALTETRRDLIKRSLDLDAEALSPILPTKITGSGKAKALTEIKTSIAAIEQLQVLAAQMLQASLEKNLIANSVEVKRAAKKGPKDPHKLLGQRARILEANFQEWYEPLAQVKDEFLQILNNHGHRVKLDVEKTAYNDLVQKLDIPFKIIVDTEIAKGIMRKKGSLGGRQAALPNLHNHPLFSRLFGMNALQEVDGVPMRLADGKKATANQVKSQKDAIEDYEKNVPDWEKRQLENVGAGYILQPKKSKGKRNNDLFNADRTDHYMVVAWKNVDGSLFEAGDDPMKITKVIIEKLSAIHVKDGMFVRAKNEVYGEISVTDFDLWSMTIERPFPPNMVRSASRGGRSALTSEQVLDSLMQWGGDATAQGNMKKMRGMTSNIYDDAYKPQRLRDNKHLVAMGKGEYRWSDEIISLWKEEKGFESERWSYGTLEEGRNAGSKDIGGPEVVSEAPPPPRPPGGASTEIPFNQFGDEWNDIQNLFQWVDENGVTHTLADTILQPRGMDQQMQFAGDSFRKTFESFFNRFPSKFRKFFSGPARAIGGQTFAASPAAKLRWKYIMSKSEGQEVSSNIGHMLDKLHDVFGSNRRNGRGTKIILKGGIGVNPRTGRLNDGGLLESKDYFRREGITKQKGHGDYKSLRGASKNADGSPMLGDEQVWGPIAEMEQKFLDLKSQPGSGWDDARILRERRKYNHMHVLQDLTTFLNTSRHDLDTFYDITSKAGLEQLKWWDYYHQVGPHLVQMLRNSGFDVDSTASVLGKAASEFRASFVPSLFLDQAQEFAPAGIGQGAVQLGMKPSQMMDRQYHWQITNKIDQGALSGKIKHDLYNTDPILALQRQAESFYEFVAQERFMDEFAKQGILAVEMNTAKHALTSMRGAVDNLGKINPDNMSESARLTAQKFFGSNYADWTADRIARKEIELTESSLTWRNMDLSKARVKGIPSEHPLHGTALPPEASKELAALISDEFTKPSAFLTYPSAIANTMRVLATGADLGVMLLHGMGGIGMMTSPNPFMSLRQRTAWARGTWNMGKAMYNPKVRSEWYVRTQITRQDMQKYGVAFFRSTHIEDLPLPGLFTKGQVRPGLQKPGVRQIERGIELLWAAPERMMNGFGFFLDVSKTEMWKVQSNMIRQNFGAVDNAGRELKTQTPQELEKMEAALNDMASGMNAIHGTLHPAAVGIPSKQRSFESAFLMYAALYRRSAVAVLRNLTSTNKYRRNLALQSISGMMAAGAAIGWAVKSQGLNEDVLDPNSADFMSIKYGNIRVGIGTPFYTYVRAAKDVIDQMGDDPGGLKEVHFSDNKILKWARSGTSPITSIGIDLLTGQEFIGDPLRDTTGGWEVNAIGKRISRTLMPFWLDTIIDSSTPIGSGDMHPSAGLMEFFGLRTSPQSPYGRLKDARNVAILLDDDPALTRWKQDQEAKNLPIDGDSLPKLLLKQLTERHPALQDLAVEMAEDVERRGSYMRKRQDEYIETVKLNKEGRGAEFNEPIGLNMQLKGLDIKFSNHEITGRELREGQELIETANRAKQQQLAETYKDVIATFNDRRLGRMNSAADQFVFDHWYDRYRQEVTGSPALHDIYGNFDSAEFKRRQQVFEDFMVDNYGAESWKYIQDLRNHGKYLPPSLKRLADARNKELGKFWDIPDRYFNKAQAELIHHWRGARTREAKEYFQAKHPYIRPILAKLRKIQDRYRILNPNVDALLVEFYDYSALTIKGKILERQRLIAAAGRPTQPVQQVSNYQVNPEMTFQEPVEVA
jgi:integrase